MFIITADFDGSAGICFLSFHLACCRGPAGSNKHPHPFAQIKTHPDVIFWEWKPSASKEN